MLPAGSRMYASMSVLVTSVDASFALSSVTVVASVVESTVEKFLGPGSLVDGYNCCLPQPIKSIAMHVSAIKLRFFISIYFVMQNQYPFYHNSWIYLFRFFCQILLSEVSLFVFVDVF